MTDNGISRIKAGTPLSQREMECLTLAALGNSNAKIGQRLYLSEDTIKTYMRKIYRRLGATDRAHAVYLAVQAGYLSAVA